MAKIPNSRKYEKGASSYRAAPQAAPSYDRAATPRPDPELLSPQSLQPAKIIPWLVGAVIVLALLTVLF